MLFKRQSFRFCEAIMTEIVTETQVVAVLNDTVKALDKDEEFDKDSGNHSGEDMETGDEVTCEEKVACDLDKEGPHCHIDGKQSLLPFTKPAQYRYIGATRSRKN